MTETLVNRLYEWREHLKKCDAWDNGDCTTLALIKQAVEQVYGVHPDNYSGYVAPSNRQENNKENPNVSNPSKI